MKKTLLDIVNNRCKPFKGQRKTVLITTHTPSGLSSSFIRVKNSINRLKR